jgi:CelD/BcsL family acetyltransferase involved in cellulose biosynthesis
MQDHSPLASRPSDGPKPAPAKASPKGRATSNYFVETITTEQRFESIANDWNRLSATAEFPNVFMTFDWFRAWNQRFAREDRSGQRRLNVLVLKKDGCIVGVAPLIRWKVSRFGISGRKMEFVGREADYNDLVLGNDPAGQTEAIVEFLAQTQNEWDMVNLRFLRETGNSLGVTEHALSNAGLTYRIVPEEERCPYMPIDAPSSELISRRSRPARHTLQKQQRRLKRMSPGGLRVRIIEEPQKEPGLLEKLIALERQKKVGGKRVDSWLARYPEVFQSLFSGLGSRGWIRVALMELGDLPVAWVWAFRCGKKLWGYNRGFNASFSRLSPGTILDTALIDYAFSHGYEEYDFLRGEEAYKRQWCTSIHQSYWLRIWSRNWIPRLHALVYLDLKPAFRRLLGRSV